MATEYYGDAQFQTMLEQRHHDDSYFSEIIQMTNEFDQDIADAMRTDIMSGNTATIRSHYKAFNKYAPTFEPKIYNGITATSIYHGEITDHTFYGILPIKDDYSNAAGVTGYHLLNDTDTRKIEVVTALDKLDMDAEEIIEEILEPDPIGAIGSPEFSDYEKAYNNSPELQAEHGSLANYHTSLVQGQSDQSTQIANLTDIFIGIYATGAKLSEVNIVALYFTMAHIFPQITFNNLVTADIPEIGNVPYAYQFASGNFLATLFWNGWSHVIRRGIVKNQFDGATVKKYKRKSNFEFKTMPDSQPSISDGDPIYQTLQTNILENNGWTTNAPAGLGMLEIQVQLAPINGVDVYGEIRIWDYGTLHVNKAMNGVDLVMMKSIMSGSFYSGVSMGVTITSPDNVNVAHGDTVVQTITSNNTAAVYGFFRQGTTDESPDAQYFTIDPASGDMVFNAPADYSIRNTYTVVIVAQDVAGNVFGTQILTINIADPGNVTQPPPHTDTTINDKIKGFDLVFFPIEYEAAREVPFFKRERFLRESVILGMYNVTEVEVKWYQSGWFKIVMIVISIILIVVTGGGFAALLSMKAIATAAATVILSTIVAKILMEAIDSPMLAAMLVLVIGAVTGNFNFSMSVANLANMASLAMEATNTYIAKYFEEKLEKLKDEMLEWQEKMKAAEEELRELAEQAGDTSLQDSSDLITYLASRPAITSASSFIDKATDVSNSIVDNVDNMTDVTLLLPEMIR